MTLKALLARLQKLTPEQLKAPARCFEGCSGNWTTIRGVIVARKDEYGEGDEPGGERFEGMKKDFGIITDPVVKKGEVYFCHDH